MIAGICSSLDRLGRSSAGEIMASVRANGVAIATFGIEILLANVSYERD